MASFSGSESVNDKISVDKSKQTRLKNIPGVTGAVGRSKIMQGGSGGGSSSVGDSGNNNNHHGAAPPTSPVPGTVRTTFSSEHEDAASLQVPDRLKFHIQEDDTTETTEKKDDGDESNKFEEFEQWLLDNGAKFPELYLKKYDKAMRGVHCKNRISPYSTIVEIPQKLLITDEMGRNCAMGRKLFSQNYSLSTPNLIAVILYILTEREDPNSFFQPYFRILPCDYSSFPIFYNEEQLSWLEGSPLIDDIVERKRNMETDYDEICRLVPEFKRFGFSEFLEIRTAVGSRNFGIVVHNNKRTAMVPYADMLNHYRPRETSWTFDDSKDSFTITSLAPLQAGQQVMDSYGKKCNSKFLLHYGFAVENNREADGHCQNEIFVRQCLNPEDSLYEEKVALLGGRSSRGFRLSMNIEDRATSEALSFARIATATESEVSALLGSHHENQEFSSRRSYRDSVNFISCANEILALEFLADHCQQQLNRYPQTMESNLELLNSGECKPFSVRRTTLIVILGEQEILQFWLDARDSIGQLLSGTADESPVHLRLRTLPRSTFKEADLARYASRLAYEIRMSSK